MICFQINSYRLFPSDNSSNSAFLPFHHQTFAATSQPQRNATAQLRILVTCTSCLHDNRWILHIPVSIHKRFGITPLTMSVSWEDFELIPCWLSVTTVKFCDADLFFYVSWRDWERRKKSFLDFSAGTIARKWSLYLWCPYHYKYQWLQKLPYTENSNFKVNMGMGR